MSFSITPSKGSSPIEGPKSTKTSKSKSTKGAELSIVSNEKQLAKPEKPKASKGFSLFSTKKKTKELQAVTLPKTNMQEAALNRAMGAIDELSKVRLGEGVKYASSTIMDCYTKHPETRNQIELKLSQTFASSANPEVTMRTIWNDMRMASTGRGFDGLARNQGFFILCYQSGLDIGFATSRPDETVTNAEALKGLKDHIQRMATKEDYESFAEKAGLSRGWNLQPNNTNNANASQNPLSSQLRLDYEFLGLETDATRDEVRAAWKQGVMGNHSDKTKNVSDDRPIGLINEAYNRIKNHLDG